MKVLVANRGEIACRILQTLRQVGIPSVAVYTDADADAPHVWLADEAQPLGASGAYLDAAALLEAARRSGATAVHPGYGFVSQSPAFADACAAAGVTFVGPSAAAMQMLGDKRRAREVAAGLGVPVVPGASACDDLPQALQAAAATGYPVLLKAAGGGGGKGMRQVTAADALPDAFAAAQREAMGAFGDARLLLERYVHPARHVEVQVLGDGTRAVCLGERECSLQRRYQKVVEESPALRVDAALSARLQAAAHDLACAAGYRGAATVEFLVDAAGAFYFLEVNTRLQVEHPVTELCYGVDIVAWQLELAAGGALPAVPTPRGHAIEVRLNAEDPYDDFLPQSGEVLALQWPTAPHLRVDAGIACGSRVTPLYDSLLAKLVCWGADREQARQRLVEALRQTVLLGLRTNQSFLLAVLGSPLFVAGETYTTTLEATSWPPPAPPPAWAAAAAAAARRAAPTAAAAAATASGDPHSPWDHLGAFRMGTCG